MIIKTADGWKDFMGSTPSEARVKWFLDAQKNGYKFEQSYKNAKEDDRKTTSWLRGVFLNLHRAAYPSGFHAPGSECLASKEKEGCPFDWTPKYLAAL